MPARAAEYINDALQLAGVLEARGFTFRLRDAHPKDPTAQGWNAVFRQGERVFSAEDASPALAVCRAALAALNG